MANELDNEVKAALFEKLDEVNLKAKEIREITHIGRTAEVTITVYVPRPIVQSCPSLNKP